MIEFYEAAAIFRAGYAWALTEAALGRDE